MLDPHADHRTYDRVRFATAEAREAFVNGAALDEGRKLAVVLGGGPVVGEDPSHTSMCVSEGVGEPSKISKAGASNWSMSESVVAKALDGSDSSRETESGRGS
jgi:hypothetical protein